MKLTIGKVRFTIKKISLEMKPVSKEKENLTGS